MIRLFVAIPLPETVRERLVVLQSGLQGARWVTPENLHLTLRFVGEVAEDVAADIGAALAGIEAPGFMLELYGVGSFGRGRNPHAVWAGVAKSEPLTHLQAKVESALVRAGTAPAIRKFAPHVTLGRLKHAKPRRVEAWTIENAAFRTEPFAIDRFALFSSFLSSSRAIYTPEAEYGLAG